MHVYNYSFLKKKREVTMGPYILHSDQDTEHWPDDKDDLKGRTESLWEVQVHIKNAIYKMMAF